MLHKDVRIPFQPKNSYSYGDIGLKPIYLSTIGSRKDVNPGTIFLDLPLSLPIVTAPMEKVVSYDMAATLHKLGGLAILPRTYSAYRDAELLLALEQDLAKEHYVGIPSIPAKDSYFSGRVFPSTFAVCIDVANGFHTHIEQTVKILKQEFPKIKIIAGNVASLEGFLYLTELGIDAVRVGIGSGSVCSTSIATGIGVGQASLIREIAECKMSINLPTPALIADGGIKTAGDIVKAIALGADVVMVGNLFAGTDEAPGDIIIHEGKKYKHFAGQASMHIKGTNTFVEGADVLVPYKKSVSDVWRALDDGIRSGMAYMNCQHLHELHYLPDEAFVLLGDAAKFERGIHANK